MAQPLDTAAQAAFAAALCSQLRESRRRQGLTQAQVAVRTEGLVSKAALANYETGHRSLRVDIFWVLARALGEDGGSLLTAAERSAGFHGDPDSPAPITIDVSDVLESDDVRLHPVRRWFEIRYPDGHPAATETLDDAAIRALAELMDVTPFECRSILLSLAGSSEGMSAIVPTPASGAAGASSGRRGGGGSPPSSLAGGYGSAALAARSWAY